MEVEVILPKPTSPEFAFNTAATAPSSPRLFGEPFDYDFLYTSAPTSPTRAASILSQFSSNEFAFDSGRISITTTPPELSTADELFDNGTIRPLHPPPLSTDQRGRTRSSFPTASENRHRPSRSLSPLRDPSTAPALPKSGSGSRKWRLKDLFLFRSASEGRATGRESRDPLRNFTLLPSLFSSSSSPSSSSDKRAGKEDAGCVSARRGNRRPAASAHEVLYATNRAAAEERRRKTPLAYQRQGLFAFIQYNPAIRSIANGFSANSSRS